MRKQSELLQNGDLSQLAAGLSVLIRSVFAGSRAKSKARTQADQSIDCHADSEIDRHAQVHLESLVTKQVRQMRHERKIVDDVANENCDEVFEPSPGSHSEQRRHHRVRRPSELAIGAQLVQLLSPSPRGGRTVTI